MKRDTFEGGHSALSEASKTETACFPASRTYASENHQDQPVRKPFRAVEVWDQAWAGVQLCGRSSASR